MGRVELVFLAISVVGALAFTPHGSIGGKDHILTEALLREVVDNMGKDFDNAAAGYLDYQPNNRAFQQVPNGHLDMLTQPMPAAAELENVNNHYQQLANNRHLDILSQPMPAAADLDVNSHYQELATNRHIDNILAQALPAGAVIENVNRHYQPSSNHFQQVPQIRHLEILARAMPSAAELENEQIDYESLIDGPRPSLRDQEFLQHSALMGHQYVSGGAGEGEQRLQPSGAVSNRLLVKSDDVMPAYCNPPNPCPVGYTEDQGCIMEFENTAAFSRDYQIAQQCMCDGEHMFSCPSESPEMDRHSIPFSEHHKGLVAKKFLPDVDMNPFLTGERLPIAAKKGFDVISF